jgi:hypothetical protein
VWVGSSLRVSRAGHLKKVSRSAIIITTQASDGSETSWINPALGIEKLIVGVDVDNFADDQIRRNRPVSDWYDLLHNAFQVHR